MWRNIWITPTGNLPGDWEQLGKLFPLSSNLNVADPPSILNVRNPITWKQCFQQTWKTKKEYQWDFITLVVKHLDQKIELDNCKNCSCPLFNCKWIEKQIKIENALTQQDLTNSRIKNILAAEDQIQNFQEIYRKVPGKYDDHSPTQSNNYVHICH